MNSEFLNIDKFYQEVSALIQSAQKKVADAAKFAQVEAYWHIGKRIVEEEQKGSATAIYGKKLLGQLAERLTQDFGQAFSERNLRHIRQFYLTFQNWNALRSELTWTHYRSLLRVDKPEAREFYMHEAADNNWSTRTLDRQIQSLYYERLLKSRDKNAVKKEGDQINQIMRPGDVLKDPYILEFVGLRENRAYLEGDLEQALLTKLNDFLLELGKGFAFVARQKRISTAKKHFYIDLVFYNYLLKCFVLIDLKVGELSHQDIGQMDMYVRLFEDKFKASDDNPTIGLILCTDHDETVVKYSVLEESQQLFASKYKLYLPSEEELKAEIEQEKANITTN